MRRAETSSRKSRSIKKINRGRSVILGFPDMGVEVRKSKIHGRGVFATKFFGAGWFIGTIAGVIKVMPDVNCPFSIWFDDSRGRYTTMLPDPPFRFLNHGSKPNAELDQVSLYASDNILPGDEITIYYSDEWEEGNAKTKGPVTSSNDEDETSE